MKKMKLLRIIFCGLVSNCIGFSAFAQNVFKIAGGTTVKTSNGVNIVLQDIDLNNDGSVNQLPGEGKFVFTGTQNNNIAGASQALLDILETAKTANAKILLQQNIGIGTAINFTSGLLDLNNKNIFLQPNALLNGESETSRILGSNGGYIEITNILNAPASANPGNLGAVLSSTQNLGNTIIRRGHTSQINGSGTGSTVLRYFDILPANNLALGATLRFKYFDAELNALDENSLVLWKSTDNIHWANQGVTERNTSANYVEKTGINDFSRWTLSTITNPLPLQFLLFNVKCEGNTVSIKWTTAHEQNTSRFDIEKSIDGIHWLVIGTVAAAGSSNSQINYFFTDNHIVNNSLYRVAEYDIDGRVHYTNFILSTCGVTDNWQIWPNPVQTILNLNINTRNESRVVIKVFDEKGALVQKQQNNLLPGNNQLYVDMKKLPSAIYQVQIEWNGGTSSYSVKIIKQ